MFEYLMPSLVMRAPAGSLLEQTSRLIVRRQIGPDLTGSGRDNLDYLLENMVDPSATVGAWVMPICVPRELFWPNQRRPGRKPGSTSSSSTLRLRPSTMLAIWPWWIRVKSSGSGTTAGRFSADDPLYSHLAVTRG